MDDALKQAVNTMQDFAKLTENPVLHFHPRVLLLSTAFYGVLYS